MVERNELLDWNEIVQMNVSLYDQVKFQLSNFTKTKMKKFDLLD